MFSLSELLSGTILTGAFASKKVNWRERTPQHIKLKQEPVLDSSGLARSDFIEEGESLQVGSLKELSAHFKAADTMERSHHDSWVRFVSSLANVV